MTESQDHANTVDSDDIAVEQRRKEILRLRDSPEFSEIRKHYGARTFFNILGVGRNEGVHSSFLAWLLDPSSDHGLNQGPLSRFLELLVRILLDTKQGQRTDELFPRALTDVIVSGAYVISEVEIEREFVIDGQKRIDIAIQFKFTSGRQTPVTRHFFVVVENKVGAEEHSSQTQNYWNWAVNNARARVRAKPEEPVHIVGVFLTPLPAADFRELSKCECECDRFIQVNYQSLADHVLQPVADMEMGYNARFLVDQYIRNLSYPDTVEELTSQDIAKGELVMAIGPKEKELLKGFFEQNESLFMAVFEAYKDSATPEFRAAIEEFEATRTGTRAAPDKPTSMKWGDGTPAPEVTSWKDVLREGIQKGIKLGVKIEDLKIDTYQDGNALRVPLEIAEGTFINAQLSARDIRRHVTNVLKASNAPAGLMKVTTIAGEVYELP